MKRPSLVPSMISLQCMSCYLICLLTWSGAELFTAISEVEPLLETHKRIIDYLDNYLQKEEEKLINLKQHLNKYKKEHVKAVEDIPNYLGNPINAFTLIKRLTTDLDFIEQSIKIGTEYDIKNMTTNHSAIKYPTHEDLTGAAQALTRLQETYLLDVNELSEGLLNGVTYSTPMTAGDSFELGRALYNEREYKNALAWMVEALRKYEQENEPYSFNEIDILEYISFSHKMLGDEKSALEWTRKLLALDSKYTQAPSNMTHYQHNLMEVNIEPKRQKREETSEQSDEDEDAESIEEKKTYETLCRGEMDLPSEISVKLHCRYLTETDPFLRLAPIKMEYAYMKPDIIIFHDVMSDDEIKFIQDLAKPRLKRAVVYEEETGALIPVSFRISKSSWLRDEESPVIERVSRRVQDMTGLSLSSAEYLQVANYGIGGHYVPHFDFVKMTDVAQGGATVFTELGVSLFPKRGTAAFWLNLHPSGEGDLATRHAACPVLRGSKWVCNKWLHQVGQELLRPCELEYQDEAIVNHIPRPVPNTSR